MVVIDYTDQIAECCDKAINELSEIYAVGYTRKDLWAILGEKYNVKYQNCSDIDGGSLVFKTDADASMFVLRYS